jgi:hypothetical protein
LLPSSTARRIVLHHAVHRAHAAGGDHRLDPVAADVLAEQQIGGDGGVASRRQRRLLQERSGAVVRLEQRADHADSCCSVHGEFSFTATPESLDPVSTARTAGGPRHKMGKKAPPL